MKPVNMGTVGTCTNNINRLGKKIISAVYVKNIHQLSSYVSKKNRTFSNSNSIYVKHKPAGFKFKKKKKKTREINIFYSNYNKNQAKYRLWTNKTENQDCHCYEDKLLLGFPKQIKNMNYHIQYHIMPGLIQEWPISAKNTNKQTRQKKNLTCWTCSRNVLN